MSVDNNLGQKVSDTDVFTEHFLSVDNSEILNGIEREGFYIIENALTENFLENIKSDVAHHRHFLNSNTVGGAYTDSQYFLVNMLACSKAFFDYCTHPKVLDVCQEVIGDMFRLKALRYYETYSNMRMAWHTDSKTPEGFAPIPGIIFIAYIEDTKDGEFQYVKGSHEWASNAKKNTFFDADFRGHDIISFKLSKGSVIVYNTHGIHRAKPIIDPNYVRKSLFFQVDGNNKSEPILVNTSYIESIDERLKMFLGFGRPGSNTQFPETRAKDLERWVKR